LDQSCTSEGRIVNVQPFAAALPREFQRAFSPVDRRQVIRVEFLPDEVPPPLFSKVKLRSADIVPGWIRAYWQSSSAPAVTEVAGPKIAVGDVLIRGTTQ
jgi:hypothetical protein